MMGKKPLGIMIAVGKDGPPPPRFKAGGDEPPPPPRRAAPQTPQHEAMESPEQEGSEEYSAKLLADIDEVGQKHGIDSTAMRALSADLFTAVAACLRGKDEQEPQGDMQGEQGEGGDY